MHAFIAWCGFLGAWLLLAGPLYQAAIELRDGDDLRARIDEASAGIPEPERVSMWWWLLPPVKLLLDKQRSDRYRHQFFHQLTHEDATELVVFINSATAWLYVALGGTLIAITETWNLQRVLGIDVGWFWVTILVMPLLCGANTIWRMRRGRDIVQHHARNHELESSSD